MSDFDRLPPDQRAVLSLLLERGKSYDEVADMLAIPESAVRDRAHAALDALAATPATGVARSRTGTPAASAQASRPRRREPRGDATRAHTALSPPGSKLGGALLLGAIVVVIVVVVVLVSGGGGGKGSSKTTAGTPTTSSSTTSSDKTQLDKTIVMSAAEPGLDATGKTLILSQGSRHAFYIAAQGLPPSSGFFYAVWLYNSPTSSTPLGRAPDVSSTGRMEGGGPLPADASSYHQLIVTRETSTHPSHPGPIVMTGTFALH
jgi:hypothetical protein